MKKENLFSMKFMLNLLSSQKIPTAFVSLRK